VDLKSYVGCEYWPTVTLNSELWGQFHFAIAAANPTSSTADVVVDRGGQTVAHVSVKPNGLETIQLPWVNELKQTFPQAQGDPPVGSALVKNGAYHVQSSVPITLYQFNPLEYKLDPPPADCPQAEAAHGCFSFTNDASLVLPTTALHGDYWVVTMPTQHYGVKGPVDFEPHWIDVPGFVTITATVDGTHVAFDAKGNVRAGGGVGSIAAGKQGTFTLNAGDVLLLASDSPPAEKTDLPNLACVDVQNGLATDTLCPTAQDWDLTGSHIRADQPVSVIAGHDCTMVPYSAFACDHTEESLIPVEALGQDLIVSAPRKVASLGKAPAPDSFFVRILSAVDGNSIQFDPPSVSGPVKLDAGQWTTVGPTTTDFRVKASDKILVAQFMVGEDFGGASQGAGDPSESLAIPSEQYRSAYSFLAPASYANNVVNVVAKTGSVVTLDGKAMETSEFRPVGSSGYSVARHEVAGGPHTIVGADPFGIVVHGYGSYTSYMYPGGLNLATIVVKPH
jgi:hypothetical protein